MPAQSTSDGALHWVAQTLATRPPSSAASLRGIRRELSRRLAGSPAREVVSAAHALAASDGFAPRFLAYELLLHHPAALESLRLTDVERLGHGMTDWGTVDTFACYVSGPAWRERQIADAAIARWARSPDRWWRRAALVSTVPLNVKARGGTGDVPRTLRICELLVDDRDDMVVKALSWALRALVTHDARAVRRFLDEHRPRLAPRVVREVTSKLDTGRKTARVGRRS